MKKSGLLPIFGFQSRQRFFVPCRDMVLYVATWVFSRRGCCVAIGFFTGCDRVIFLLGFCRDRVSHGVATMFVLFRDPVATKFG